MGNYVDLSIELDEELKNEFEKVCKELGISVEAALTAFAEDIVKRGYIPFDTTDL